MQACSLCRQRPDWSVQGISSLQVQYSGKRLAEPILLDKQIARDLAMCCKKAAYFPVGSAHHREGAFKAIWQISCARFGTD